MKQVTNREYQDTLYIIDNLIHILVEYDDSQLYALVETAKYYRNNKEELIKHNPQKIMDTYYKQTEKRSE